MSSSRLNGLFLLWFDSVSRQNAGLSVGYCLPVYLGMAGWPNHITGLCLPQFVLSSETDIIAFQLLSPSLLLANVQCGGLVEGIYLRCCYVKDKATLVTC